MRLTLLLCDHAAVADGKLYVNGGGWNAMGPEASSFGIAVLIEVPWDRTNRPIPFRMRLFHEDGPAVVQPGSEGDLPITVGADVEVGRPAGVPAGTALTVPLAINLPPLPLVSGHGYFWQAELDGETDSDWRLSFRMR